MLIILRNKKEISNLLEPRCVPLPFLAKNTTQGFGISLIIYEQMFLLQGPFPIKTCPDFSPPWAPLSSQQLFQHLSAFLFGELWPKCDERHWNSRPPPLRPLPKEECREAQITFRCNSLLLEPIYRNKKARSVSPGLYYFLFFFFFLKILPPLFNYCGLELFH